MSLDPVVLFFLLGVAGGLARADLKFPPALYETLSIYLLLAIGLKGGVELARQDVAAVALPALAVVALGVINPCWPFRCSPGACPAPTRRPSPPTMVRYQW